MAELKFDFDAFFKSLEFTNEKVKRGAERGMHDATDDLLRESVNLAPLDKGTLRRSASKGVEVTSNGVVGEVTYSVTETSGNGERINYALYQHELGESYKDPTTPGTQPKFLERPLKQNAERYRDMIAEEIRRELT